MPATRHRTGYGHGLDAPVVVVGGGPVGLTLAMDLATRGVRVIVLERRYRGEPPGVKCNHVSARSMETFRRLGLADTLRGAGLPRDFPHDAAYRTSVLGFELSRTILPSPEGRAAGAPGADTWWPTAEPPHRINQRFMEPLVVEHAAALPQLDLRNRTEVLEVSQDDECVTAVAQDLESGEDFVLRCEFLVGCDGPRSLVRRAIGARLDGPPLVGQVQSTLIRAPDLLARLGDGRAWTFGLWNRRRSGAVFAIDGREQWLVHTGVGPGESFEALDRDSALRALLGVDDDFEYEIVSIEDYEGRGLVADRFRDRRIMLAGDAAHLWLPFAGYGMNAGIADAADLSWQLAGHLQGWAGAGLLDAYQRERQPVTAQVARYAMGLFSEVIRMAGSVPAAIEDSTPEGERARAEFGRWAYEVNTPQYACGGLNFGTFYDNSPIIAYDGEPPPPYTLDQFTVSTVPGCRVPHVVLDGAPLYDLLGPWFTLLRTNPAVDAEPLLGAAAHRGVPMQLVDLSGPEVERCYDRAMLIARPDQHVGWRGDQPPSDPLSVIDRLRGADGNASASAAAAA